MLKASTYFLRCHVSKLWYKDRKRNRQKTRSIIIYLLNYLDIQLELRTLLSSLLFFQESPGRPWLPPRRGPTWRKQSGSGCSTCRTIPTTSIGLAGRNSWSVSAREWTPASSWADWPLNTAPFPSREPFVTPSTKTTAPLMDSAAGFPAPALLCPAWEPSETRPAPAAALTRTPTACPPPLRCLP